MSSDDGSAYFVVAIVILAFLLALLIIGAIVYCVHAIRRRYSNRRMAPHFREKHYFPDSRLPVPSQDELAVMHNEAAIKNTFIF